MLKRLMVLLLLAGVIGGAAGREFEFAPLAENVDFCRIEKRVPLPQLIHILRIPLGRPNLRFSALLGCDRARGVERMDAMLGRVKDARPVAAINADYFVMTAPPKDLGTICGTMVLDREIIGCPVQTERSTWGLPFAFCYSTGPGKLALGSMTLSQKFRLPDGKTGCFAINGLYMPERAVLYTPRLAYDRAGNRTDRTAWQTTGNRGVVELVLESAEKIADPPLVRFGRVRRFRIAEVRTGGDSPIAPERCVLALSRQDGAAAAGYKVGDPVEIDFGGTPEMANCEMLVSARSNLLDQGRVLRNRQAYRAPRSGAGVDGKYLYLLVADGRAKSYAAGLTIDEMAEIFAELGCRQAVDFDGGGSSMLFVGDKLFNRLYSLPEVRGVANALVVLDVKK